ncbi:MAG: hypothetical protein H0X30_29970 [Anaerolineae bacterium]|nr:hypothetical protein [Anaerolineae bacterium]
MALNTGIVFYEGGKPQQRNKPHTHWKPLSNAQDVTLSIISDDTAYSGGTFLRARTTTAGGSIALDLDAYIRNNSIVDYAQDDTSIFPASIGVFAQIRTIPGRMPVSGRLVLWQLRVNSTYLPNHPDTSFTVGPQWTLITNHLTFVPGNAANQGGAEKMRIEFYIDTVDTDFDIGMVIAV